MSREEMHDIIAFFSNEYIINFYLNLVIFPICLNRLNTIAPFRLLDDDQSNNFKFFEILEKVCLLYLRVKL